MNQFVSHRFVSQYRATIGADFLTKEIEIDGERVSIQVLYLRSELNKKVFVNLDLDLGYSWTRAFSKFGRYVLSCS